MKQIILVLSGIISFSNILLGQGNNLKEDKIHGNVKIVIDTIYNSVKGDNKNLTLFWLEKSNYNTSGNRISKYGMDPNKHLFSSDTFKYDEKGRLIEKYTMESNGMHNISRQKLATDTVVTKEIYKYNEKNQIEEEEHNGPNYSSKILFAYDEKGNIAERKVYSQNGAVYKECFKYDVNSNVAEDYNYDPDSVKNRVVIRKYDQNNNNINGLYYNGSGVKWGQDTLIYDGRNNLLSMKFYNANGTQRPASIYSYDGFDNKGNWLKKTSAFGVFYYSVTKRTLEYYQ